MKAIRLTLVFVTSLLSCLTFTTTSAAQDQQVSIDTFVVSKTYNNDSFTLDPADSFICPRCDLFSVREVCDPENTEKKNMGRCPI